MLIESSQNPRIKKLQKLQSKSRERKKTGRFTVEGIQENHLALQAGYNAIEFFVCDSIYDGSLHLPENKAMSVSTALYEKLTYRKTTGGVIGVYEMKQNSLEEVSLGNNPLVVVLESVEKPGNLGAVLRTCDGAGVDLLIVCDPLTDFFNPNVIRSSVGTVFTNKIAAASKEEVANWLKSNKLRIFSTYLREDTMDLYAADFKGGTALILGTEHEGLTDFWAAHSDVLIKIPMQGKVDSLNVSAAAAICIYEAVRQRSLS